MKRALILLLILLPLGSAIWYFTRPKPIVVPLTEVGRGTVELISANSRAGTIRACQRSGLSLPVGGRVERLLVKEGDRVHKGQLLLQLHDQEQRALLLQAQANLKAAELERRSACQQAALSERDRQRAESLARKNLISGEALDRKRTDAQIAQLSCQQAAVKVEQVDAQRALYQVQLDDMQLRAPFSGIVAQINGELGEYSTPSPPGVATPPAVDLIDDSCLYVRAPIDEVEAARLKEGQPARITLDAFRGQTFNGTLTRIAPYVSELEKQARTVDVDVQFTPVPKPEKTRLLVGYSADVEIITDRADNQLRIPTDTLLEGHYVLKYDPATSTLQKVEVTTGSANWTWTAITSGLKAGDLILSRLDTEGAVAGAEVQIQSKASP